MPLTLHKAVDWGTSGNRWGYAKLDMVLRRTNRGEVEVVLLHEPGGPHCDSDHEARLRVGEAKALRDKLEELLGLT